MNVADDERSTSAATDIALPSAAVVDLGRNRALAATNELGDDLLLPLDGTASALVVRWRLARGCERFTDRVIRLAATDQPGPANAVGEVATAIRPGLGGRAVHRMAVPPAFGPASRQAMIDGLRSSGISVSANALVERPVAALAGWFVRRSLGTDPLGLVVAVDNDGGELSAVTADLESQRLLAVEPLSVGPNDDHDVVADRFRDLIDRSCAMLPSNAIFRDTSWAALSSRVGTLVLSGSGADHPQFRRFLAQLFPAAQVTGATEVSPSHAVVSGLLHIDVLRNFSCCWPTQELRLGGHLLRRAGGYSPDDHQPLPVRPGVGLTIGSVPMLRQDGHEGVAVTIPDELGLFPHLELLPDGRLLIHGDRGVKPVAFRVPWPVPSLDRSILDLERIGTRRAPLQRLSPDARQPSSAVPTAD